MDGEACFSISREGSSLAFPHTSHALAEGAFRYVHRGHGHCLDSLPRLVSCAGVVEMRLAVAEAEVGVEVGAKFDERGGAEIS